MPVSRPLLFAAFGSFTCGSATPKALTVYSQDRPDRSVIVKLWFWTLATDTTPLAGPTCGPPATVHGFAPEPATLTVFVGLAGFGPLL